MKIFKQIFPVILLISFIVFAWNQQQTVSSHLGGDFKIPSTGGEFNLVDYRNKVVILYFGYRFCPDICPTTLSTLAGIYKELTPLQQNLVQVVFISVDNERDTITNLKQYVEFFHKDFIGATDVKNNIVKLTNIYGVKYKKFYPNEKEKTHYSVDHSAEAFIIGKDGKIKDIIPHAEPFNKTKNKIINIIKE
jgi:protein SCO1/2